MADQDLSGRTFGEFTLCEQIGEGGHGAIYRAEQPTLEREVVVKVLRNERSSPAARERFLREARLAAQLRHPYATPVYAFGTADDGNLLWIAMERVQGVSLADWLKQHGPMPLQRFVPFFDHVCQVVHAAHERGIVHRDLKPSNIMVIELGDRLTAKLLDLGIARGSWKRRTELVPGANDTDVDEDCDTDRFGALTDRLPVRPRRAGRKGDCWDSETRRRLTPPDATLGTSQYMAPEQFGGADTVGPEADVYALGVIAYETLTGSRPFVADNTRDWFEQHHHAPMPPLLGDDFPPALDKAIRGALQKHGQVRTWSALELADNLWKALRTTKREQLRTSAQQWFDDRCPKGLLWGADVLEETLRSVPQQTLSPLESMFLKNSQRRIRRIRWAKRALVVVAVIAAIGGFLYRAEMHTELAKKQTQLAQEQASSARKITEATITQAELEQGRSALLHGEPEAPVHLGRAYRHGDHSPSTMFMLARALQPRLAEQARFTSTFGRMWSATFSPDGRQIATADDRDAQVRNAETGKLLFTLPHGNEVYNAAYSADGSRLVTVAEDAIRIWNTNNGTLVHKLTQKHSDGRPPDYFVAAISSDGKLVSAMDLSGSVAHVWDAVTGAPLAQLDNDPMDFAGLAFSSDGHWLATTGGNNVQIFNTRTWIAALTIRGPRIRSLAFDPTGTRIITGAATGDASIWSIPSGDRIQHLRDVREPVDAVAFSPDGQLAVTGSREGAVQVWRAGSGELQNQLNPRHSNITAVEFDRASRLVLAAGGDGSVVVADVTLGMPVTVLEGPQNVRVAHFDPSSHRVVGASLDGTAWIWDASSPYRRWSSPPVANDCNLSPTSTSVGRFPAFGCWGRTTRVWDTTRDQLLAELPGVSRVEGDFTSALPAVSASGDRAAIARGNTVEVYELPGAKLLHTIVHGAAVNAVGFGGTTGQDIVSGAVDGSLLVTRDDGTRLALPTFPGGVDTVTLLPDGRVIAADAQRRMRIYDSDGVIKAELEIPARAMSLVVNGDHLVSIPNYNSGAPPILVDIVQHRIIAKLDSHVGQVFSARWVTGDHLLTAGVDGTARLWDGTTGQLRQTYRGRSRILTTATVTPEGFVMAGGADGVLQFWDMDSGRLLWALHVHASPIVGLQLAGSDIVTLGSTGELSRWALPSPGKVIRACGDHEHCAIVLR